MTGGWRFLPPMGGIELLTGGNTSRNSGWLFSMSMLLVGGLGGPWPGGETSPGAEAWAEKEPCRKDGKKVGAIAACEEANGICGGNRFARRQGSAHRS
jgi:hypothetical protein